MPCPQQPQPSPNVQSSFSREEIDEALKGEDDDHVDIDDNYMELLEEGGDDASVNPTTQN
jgi:CBS-domain-containing membrane protein